MRRRPIRATSAESFPESAEPTAGRRGDRGHGRAAMAWGMPDPLAARKETPCQPGRSRRSCPAVRAKASQGFISKWRKKVGGPDGTQAKATLTSPHRDGAAPEHQPHAPALARQQMTAVNVRRKAHPGVAPVRGTAPSHAGQPFQLVRWKFAGLGDLPGLRLCDPFAVQPELHMLPRVGGVRSICDPSRHPHRSV